MSQNYLFRGIEIGTRIVNFFRNVSFTYVSEKSKRVIQNLSLDIPCGKTTKIKLMLGFYPPAEGDVIFGNHSLKHISFRDWWRKILWCCDAGK